MAVRFGPDVGIPITVSIGDIIMSDKTSPLKSRVTGRVRFSFYRNQALWYTTDDGWQFPVPVSDTDNQQGGSATFLAEDKAITFMRWIRKHIELEASYSTQTADDSAE